jgi:uncharacterized protein YqhQ
LSNFLLGGSAVLEGVMIFSPYCYAVACRKGEEVVIYKESFPTISPLPQSNFLSRLPFIRGIFAFFISLAMSLRAYLISNKLSSSKDVQKVSIDKPFLLKAFLNLILAFVLFLLLPDLISRLFRSSLILASLFETIVRILFLIFYILLFSLFPSGKRLLQYHGAEHKVINGFEDGAELTPEGLQSYPTIHIRCGTTLFALVLLLLFFLYLPFEGLAFPLSLLCKTLLFPLALPIAFELIFLAMQDERFRFLLIPGLLLQRITTKQPDNEQLEVAIAALKEVVGIA